MTGEFKIDTSRDNILIVGVDYTVKKEGNIYSIKDDLERVLYPRFVSEVIIVPGMTGVYLVSAK